MGIIEAIGQGFRAVAEIFGFASKRTDLKNSPAIVAAKEGQSDVSFKDEVEKEVAGKDIDALRKKIAE